MRPALRFLCFSYAKVRSTTIPFVVLFFAAVATFTVGSIGLQAGQTVSAQSVTKTYVADEGTQVGMVIQLSKNDQTRVSPATQADLQAIHGVVVLPNDAPLSLSELTSERQVYVATSGAYKVLVSDQSGPIKKDDYIAVSSIEGVGMRADSQPNVVVGKAVTGFDGATDIKGQTKVTDSNGKERTVNFGYITADIDVIRNPLVKDTEPNIPSFLREATEGIADKQVSPLRAYLSLVIAFVTMVIVVVVMYSGIRSSLVAMGRNPLARKSISRNLLQIVLVGVTILIVGLFGVYLVLKL